MLSDYGMDRDPDFAIALEAVLEVLPVSRSVRGFDFDSKGKALESASEDFDALEKLRRLAFSDLVDEPKQLKLWREESA